MSRIRLTTSAAIVALGCALGGAALAQDAAQMPAWLQGLDLQNLQTEAKRHGGQEIEGRLPGGGKIEVKLDRDGNPVEIEADDVPLPQQVIDAVLPDAVRGHEAMGLFARIQDIKTERGRIEIEGYQQNGDDLELEFDAEGRLVAIDADDTALPQSLVDALLPQAVLGSDVLGQFASIDEIKLHGEGRFRVEGRDETGQHVRVMVDQDGRLLRFGRDDGSRKGPGGWQERGAHGERDAHGDAPRARFHGEGMRPDPRRSGGPRAEAPELAFDPVEVNQRLTEAGYSGFGLLRQDGPRLVLEAQNPAGEPVTLELDSAGEVVRETAR